MIQHDHFVEFYETDSSLGASVGEFLATGLIAGEAAIVLATPEHREQFARLLGQRGVDVLAAIACDRYVAVDAKELLDRVGPDGVLEPVRFREIVGGMLARAGRGGRRVRMFGELVGLLAAHGRFEAAVQLEQLWNALARDTSFSLFCAYPIAGFARASDRGSFLDVCGEHSHVVVAERPTPLASADERDQALALLQQRARVLKEQVRARGQMLESERRARSEAESANRARDVFLATISHELRTPLNAILGWSVLLRREGRPRSTELSEGLAVIERNARAQARLIDDMLDISRIVAGKLLLHVESLDLVGVIGAAVDSVRPAAGAKEIVCEIEVDTSVGVVRGDPERLQQVLWNLLINSVKFSPRGAKVRVRLDRQGTMARIVVADEGQGIEPAFLPHLFERFWQADSGTTRMHGGLGLGLAIVRHIVELHGGTVRAESAGLGLGATFSVELPAGEPAECR